jgi:hypothetical protein
MVDPESAAKIVPLVTVRRERRPGTRPRSLSSAVSARAAMFVCQRISPIRTNSGIGSRLKEVTEP